MTLDLSASRVLQLLESLGGPKLYEMTPTEARQAFAQMAALGGDGAAVAGVAQREVGGVPALVVTPNGAGPFPVLVWIHGGGWVIGSASESLATAQNLASKAGCVVVSLDYGLAPERKAPGPIDDCAAAVGWVLDHAAELSGDPHRVAVGGDSAGGHLSAMMSQRFGPRLVGALLVYPATDGTLSHPSIEENADGYLLTKVDMEWFGGHFLDGTGLAHDDPRVSPIHAADDVLAASPPTLVITAGYDPLRDEGEAYAERLRSVGVETTTHRFPGQIHGFFSMPAMVPEAVEAEDLAAEFLRGRFGL